MEEGVRVPWRRGFVPKRLIWPSTLFIVKRALEEREGSPSREVRDQILGVPKREFKVCGSTFCVEVPENHVRAADAVEFLTSATEHLEERAR